MSTESSYHPPRVDSIYKASRRIKRTEHTLYNALRSIYEDSLFVQEIRNLWRNLPFLANLRCGLWYASEFDGTCYFKSTDGHNGNWSFNITRLNLHVALLAAEQGGCFIVDATRKGKRFPDSMSKTIPIWACVLNRALADFYATKSPGSKETAEPTEENTLEEDNRKEMASNSWDCSLHLPLWVSHVEKANIESRIEGWVGSLKSAGAELAVLAKLLKKPLRPLWISQKTIIWLNEVPNLDDWSFTPVILVSASKPSLFAQRFAGPEFSWSYIPGAADDEESWARGLTPSLFWKNSVEILRAGPGACNSKVSDMIEQNRVYRAMRGHHAPQVRVKAGVQSSVESSREIVVALSSVNTQLVSYVSEREHDGIAEQPAKAPSLRLNIGEGIKDGLYEDTRAEVGFMSRLVTSGKYPGNMQGFHWIGNTGLAVGNADIGKRDSIFEMVDCVINCGAVASMASTSYVGSYLYLPIVGPKFDRHSLQNHLEDAIVFATEKLMIGCTLFIYCSNGEDISVCVCLAVLLSCFNLHGESEDKCTSPAKVTKCDVRQRLIYLSSFNSDARPTRGSLRQVFNYFSTRAALLP